MLNQYIKSFQPVSIILILGAYFKEVSELFIMRHIQGFFTMDSSGSNFFLVNTDEVNSDTCKNTI